MVTTCCDACPTDRSPLFFPGAARLGVMETDDKEPIRRLSAVWFADIVGFTALTSKDEAEAIRHVNFFQALSRRVVEDTYHGRVVKFIGDATLAEFKSTDAAVRAALVMQDEYTHGINSGSTLRIAVHLGEVLAA